MNQQQARDILSGRRRGVGPAIFRTALAAASLPYRAAMGLRRWAYQKAILPSHSALGSGRQNIPVICVGNITTGGTGKTPMVAWVVGQLKSRGASPAILTRGYKAAGGKSDEAQLLEQLTGAPVIVNADRVAGAAAAIAQGADVLVLDDGFQHRRLKRDLDIVLIDATNQFGYGHCLPRGLLRESPSALKDAHCVIITRSDEIAAGPLADLRRRLSGLAPQASIHLAAHRPAALIDGSGVSMPLENIRGKKIFAFCGVANPESFWASLERLGATLCGRCALDDHAQYTPQILRELAKNAQSQNAELFVTTQKDFVKLDLSLFPLPVWQLAISMEIVDGREELIQKIGNVSGH